jgi:hypothetical protein
MTTIREASHLPQGSWENLLFYWIVRNVCHTAIDDVQGEYAFPILAIHVIRIDLSPNRISLFNSQYDKRSWKATRLGNVCAG